MNNVDKFNSAQMSRQIINEYVTNEFSIEVLFHAIDNELRNLIGIIGGQQMTIEAQQRTIITLQKQLKD